MDRVLDAGLLAVRAGEETFDDFARRTKSHWQRLGQYIARRWRQPTWSSEEDLVQELLVAAWYAVWNWDEKRGVPISRYVVFNACDKSKKKAHKARGAKLHGNSDNNPSRTEIAFSGLSSRSADPEVADRRVELLLRQEPTQESDLEQHETVDRVLALCTNARERHVVREAALAGLFEDALALDELA